MTNHIVENLEQPMRLDRYLRNLMPKITQGTIEKSIRSGKIRIANLKTESSSRLKTDSCLYIDDELKKQHEIEIQNYPRLRNQKLLDTIKNAIIFEDDNLIVLNKPSGIACQGGSKLSNSLDKIMNELYAKQVRIVHRLDKDTTGVMLFAKNLKYAQILTRLFHENKIKKTYHAICEQSKLNRQYMTNKYVEQILNMETISLDVPLTVSQIGGEEKIFVNYNSNNKSQSNIRLLKILTNNLYFFEIKPKTGKKHQIRVHLQHLCFPILGDKKYNYSKLSDNLFLHATKVEIPDLNLIFNCDLPEHFRRYL